MKLFDRVLHLIIAGQNCLILWDVFFKHEAISWPKIIFLSLSVLLLAAIWFVPRKELRGSEPAASKIDPFKNPKFEIVIGQSYRNTSIEIDGKSFRRCSFANTKLVFVGRAPYEFASDCEFGEELELTTENQAIIQYQRLRKVLQSMPGAKIKEYTFDASGNPIPQKISFQLAPPKEKP